MSAEIENVKAPAQQVEELNVTDQELDKISGGNARMLASEDMPDYSLPGGFVPPGVRD